PRHPRSRPAQDRRRRSRPLAARRQRRADPHPHSPRRARGPRRGSRRRRRRPPRGSAPMRVGDLSLNADTHEVARGERQIELTQREFELLEYLMRNERIVISRQRLLDEVWGYDPFSTTNTIEVFVSNLRRKLEAEEEPRLLHTIRGAGYVLRA